MAYGVLAQSPGLPLRIVPCGLTYIHRRHFRSRVLVQYGPPITIGAEGLARFAADERKAVRDLTADIDAGLRALTINASDWDTLRVLDAVRRMYQPPKIPLRDRVELARRFSLVYEQVKDEPEVARLFERVRDYNRRLRDVGLSDAQLSQPLRPVAVAGKVVWQLWWVLVLLPLAAPGVVVHAPIGMVWAGQKWAPRKDVVGTSKLVVGLLLVAIVYASLLGVAALTHGWRALVLVLVLLPLSAYARQLPAGVHSGHDGAGVAGGRGARALRALRRARHNAHVRVKFAAVAGPPWAKGCTWWSSSWYVEPHRWPSVPANAQRPSSRRHTSSRTEAGM